MVAVERVGDESVLVMETMALPSVALVWKVRAQSGRPKVRQGRGLDELGNGSLERGCRRSKGDLYLLALVGVVGVA